MLSAVLFSCLGVSGSLLDLSDDLRPLAASFFWRLVGPSSSESSLSDSSDSSVLCFLEVLVVLRRLEDFLLDFFLTSLSDSDALSRSESSDSSEDDEESSESSRSEGSRSLSNRSRLRSDSAILLMSAASNGLARSCVGFWAISRDSSRLLKDLGIPFQKYRSKSSLDNFCSVTTHPPMRINPRLYLIQAFMLGDCCFLVFNTYFSRSRTL